MIRPPYARKACLISTTNQAKQVAKLARIAIGCTVYFFVVVVVLHLLRPDTNPVRQAVSNYAVGPYGLLMTSAFFALALGMFALSLGLARNMMPTRRELVGTLLLYVASAGMVVVGIFPGDVNVPHPPATVTGLIHWLAAGVSFLSIMIAAFLLSHCFKEDERWQSFHRLALVLAITAVVALVVYGILVLLAWVGIGERIYITMSLLWLLLTAVRLLSLVTGKGNER